MNISVMFFYPVLHRFPCFPDVYFAALTWNFIDDTVGHETMYNNNVL